MSEDAETIEALRERVSANNRVLVVVAGPNGAGKTIIVAATNHPGLLDRALRRRFDAVIEYGLPKPEVAEQVLRSRLALLKTSRVNWKKVLSAAKGLSQAEIGSCLRTRGQGCHSGPADQRRHFRVGCGLDAAQGRTGLSLAFHFDARSQEPPAHPCHRSSGSRSLHFAANGYGKAWKGDC